MAYLCPIKLSERRRTMIIIVTLILNGFIILGSLLLFGTGIYTLVYLTSKSHVLRENFPIALLGSFYIALSAYLFIVSVVLFIVFYHLRKVKHRYLLGKNSLIYVQIVYLVATVLVPVMIIFTTYHIHALKSGFEEGLNENIEKYATDMNRKQVIDDIQHFFGCCGSKSYRDWFDNQWVKDEYKDDHNYKTGLPFSCCNVSYLGVCINENLFDVPQSEEVNEDYLKSLNNRGCAQLFTESLNWLLNSAIIFWICILILQIATNILFQYWRTSLANALKDGDAKGKAIGYLWDLPDKKRKHKKHKDYKKHRARDDDPAVNKPLLDSQSDNQSDASFSDYNPYDNNIAQQPYYDDQSINSGFDPNAQFNSGTPFSYNSNQPQLPPSATPDNTQYQPIQNPYRGRNYKLEYKNSSQADDDFFR